MLKFSKNILKTMISDNTMDEGTYLEKINKEYESYRDIYSSKLQFICEHIFDITTYESYAAEVIGLKMLEVCDAILNNKTFDYIENDNNRINYLTMVNMPFLANKIEWGISIRGAWFDDNPYTTDIFYCIDQGLPRKDIKVFILDLIKWSRYE